MNRPTFDDALVPLTSDALISERVESLIGRANLRQLWMLFLDDQLVQLPVLLPIDGMPSDPTERATDRVMETVAYLMADIGASSVVLVWERWGPEKLTPQDVAWARSLHSACDAAGITLRAMLLSHRRGVRWIAQDDYRF